jgi:archaemetzincin
LSDRSSPGSHSSQGNTRKKSIDQISIYPFENANLSQFREALETAAALYELEAIFCSDVYLTSELAAIERSRGQRNSVTIIQSVEKSLSDLGRRSELNLIVTSQDLFAEKMNFIFGLAYREKGIAVMSVARLTTRYDEQLDTPLRIQERILKEAAHEIGHLIGLSHCKKASCLMAFSETLQMVDDKLPMICEICSRKLVGKSR